MRWPSYLDRPWLSRLAPDSLSPDVYYPLGGRNRRDDGLRRADRPQVPRAGWLRNLPGAARTVTAPQSADGVSWTVMGAGTFTIGLVVTGKMRAPEALRRSTQ